jgi:predicted nucleic acid-binding protein
MKIVIDANITVSLFVPLPYSGAAENMIRLWRKQGAELYAPGLWQVEIVSVVRKMVSLGQMNADGARFAIANLDSLQVEIVHPDRDLLEQSYLWAERIGQRVAYDAQYLALAESIQADFWSADQRLISALQARQIPWAHSLLTD